MTKTIPLSQGKRALVDDADYEWLTQWNWTVLENRSKWYAVRHDYSIQSPEFIYMHRLLLQTPKGLVSHHLNGDSLDNRRSNLVICQQGQHIRYHQSDRDERAKRLQNFGATLNFVRTERDLTLTELEQLSGISGSALSNIERGKSIPRKHTISRLKESLPGLWQRPANAQLRRAETKGHRKQSGKTSQFVGISWSRADHCWRAEIRVNYRLIFLGHFDSEEKAARVWNVAALRHRGAKARLNTLPEMSLEPA